MDENTITSTPYDDVFRTLLVDCTHLIIPVINETFHENYSPDAEILINHNEIFLHQQNGEETKQITDSSFILKHNKEDKGKGYHLECQSSPDGSMAIRMYEYDSQIALRHGTFQNHKLTVEFPHSAVLYLRHNKNTPDNMEINIQTPGGSISYMVPIIKIQTYHINTILEKNLLMFIPFYIFCYEKRFKRINESRKELHMLQQEYFTIIEHLNALCSKGLIDEYTKTTIIEMSTKVLDHISKKYERVRKGVKAIMGGKVLDYPAKTIYQAEKKDGEKQGLKQGENVISILNQRLRDDGRIEELMMSFDNAELRHQLLEEYGLSLDPNTTE